jgi:hypothetical protein
MLNSNLSIFFGSQIFFAKRILGFFKGNIFRQEPQKCGIQKCTFGLENEGVYFFYQVQRFLCGTCRSVFLVFLARQAKFWPSYKESMEPHY